ncbi:THAP domain-containing protein [Ooceraea biroi]|uniref:THAP domain-containing protein n=1 Tax=Ooceraea biroi TaxID=2015173 RepID=A0A026X490_OOCBI|nr:THAP domain-containing protein [Ooceraea biroi]
MDGCASNIATMQCLGANISKDNARPYFIHPQTKEKVYVMLDACHMIKLIRNAFATCKNMHDGNGNRIEWQYIMNLVQLQEEEGLHAATKVTKRYLNWQQEKMNVKLAAQTLSTDVANAIDFCAIDLQLQQFQNSAATSLFIKNMNNIFDLLNSRNFLCKNKSQEPISLSNIDRVKEDIKKYIDYLNNLYIDNVNIMSTKKKTGFLGMLICLVCIRDISNELIATKKMNFLLTYKMSQDHIEMFFSAIRSKGGHNNNPSAKQFCYAYRRLLHHTKLTILLHGNAIAQDNTDMLNIRYPNKGIDNIVNDFIESEKENEGDISDETFITERWCTSNYIKDVVAYIAGFVTRKVIKKIKCDICQKLLIGTDNVSALQERKCRGGLINASNDVITLCYIAEKVIREHSSVINKQHPIERLILIALSCVSSTIFDNVLHMFEQAPLQDHRTDLIKFVLYTYLQLRLRHISVSKN